MGTDAGNSFGCDGTSEAARFATPRKDGSTVKKLFASVLTLALTFAFAAGMCLTVSGCPKTDTKSGSGTGTGGGGGGGTATK